MNTSPKLTRLQEDVLFVVSGDGPVTPRDVAYHLLITEGSARGVLARLEQRGLVDAVYTGHHREGQRAFVARRFSGSVAAGRAAPTETAQ